MSRHRESDVALQTLADTQDAVLVLDGEHVVRYANPAAFALFGDRISLGIGFGMPLTSSLAQEMVIPSSEGEMTTVEMRVGETVWEEGPAEVLSFRDVTERIASQDRIEHLNRVLRAIRKVNKLILRESDPTRLVEQACALLIETRGYNGAWIALGDGIAPATVVVESGWAADFSRFKERLLQGQWPSCLESVFDVETCYVVAPHASACAKCPLAEKFGTDFSAVTRLRHGGITFGVLGVSFPGIAMNEEERSLLAELADDLAFALHDIDKDRQRAQATRETAALLHANQVVLDSADFATAARRVFDICKEQTGASAGYVALRKGENENGVLFLDDGGSGCTVDPSLPMPIRGLRAEAYHENRVVFDNAFEASPHVQFLPEGHAPLRNVMFVPITLEGEVRGIIGLANKDGNFDKDDARRAKALGEVAAIALQRSLSLEALKEAEERHRRAQKVARIGHWELDSYDGKPIWSDEIFHIVGLDPESAEPLAVNDEILDAAGDWRIVSRALSEGFDSASPFDLTFCFMRPDGRACWINVIGTPQTDADGKVLKMFGTAQDVTDRVEFELERDEFRRRLELALQSSNVGLWDYYPIENRVVFADQWKRQLGYEPDEIPEAVAEWENRLHPEDRPRVTAYLEHYLSLCTGDEYEIRFRLRHRDGKYLWILARGRAIAFENGKVSRMLGCHIDITEKTRAENDLIEEKRRAQQYLDVAAVVLLGLDAEGRVNLLNRRGCEVLGLEDEGRALGREWFEFVPEAERENVKRVFQQIMHGELSPVERVENFVQTKAGEIRRILWHNAVVPGKDGKCIGTISSGEDITERREMESQLAQADRLSSMGMLAAGVAHEINNPLTYILYNMESIVEDLPRVFRDVRNLRARLSDCGNSQSYLAAAVDSMQPALLDDILERFKVALNGTLRIRDIARGLGTFSRVEKDELVPVNLRDVLQTAADMAYNEIKYRARLVKDFSKIPTVLASEGRLSQVFLNLIINATHAIDEGDVEDNEIRLRTWSEGDTVFAEVRDTGSGIPSENLHKLFEPFYTTKKVGSGSGLGLAISKNIVEGYGGTIAVQSKVGSGTRFIVSLPVRVEGVEIVPSSAAVNSPAKARGRILIVDDEEGIRTAMTMMLSEHDTVQAGDGAAAKEIIGLDPAFDLILCDMMMPDMSGVDLHQWLVAEHPFLAEQFIFVTGGAFTPRTREYLKKVDNIRLEKPFDVTNFKKIVNELVEKVKK